MGNCMETCSEGEKQEKEEERGVVEKNGVSMKVVLTKEELKWLLLKLNEKRGMRVEEMVAELERGRDKVKGSWKPSLDTILEAPEMLLQMEMENTTSSPPFS